MIGGWAYNRYAEPRFTGDIDFFVSTDTKNQQQLRVALEKFGFQSSLPPLSQPLFRKKVIMLGRPPHRIDLLSEIDGVEFQECWDDREEGLLDGLTVNFISKRLLIKNKEATGRDKDLLDAKNLKSQS